MRVVLTGGKFNRIHKGHLWFLKNAKNLGDKLVVVLANDKNNKRPYAMPAKQRKKQLEELGIADKVVVGDEKDFYRIIKKTKPSVIALGYDQVLPRGVKEKLDKKIRIVRLKRHGDYSTRKKHAKN